MLTLLRKLWLSLPGACLTVSGEWRTVEVDRTAGWYGLRFAGEDCLLCSFLSLREALEVAELAADEPRLFLPAR